MQLDGGAFEVQLEEALEDCLIAQISRQRYAIGRNAAIHPASKPGITFEAEAPS